jgi:hypothetical protein
LERSVAVASKTVHIGVLGGKPSSQAMVRAKRIGLGKLLSEDP